MDSQTNFEKGPRQSKKFVAYLVAEITWKIALIVLIVIGLRDAQIDMFVGSVALAIVIVAGFVEVGYVLGQASLDRYTRVAQIAAQGKTPRTSEKDSENPG